MSKHWSWTQPCCNTCWDNLHPNRQTHRDLVPATEICVYCGESTQSGIYVRVDPREAAFPTNTK